MVILLLFVSQVMVEVVLEDENDNAPIFNPPAGSNGGAQEKFVMNVMENVEPNRNIGIINVTDYDKGKNGEFETDGEEKEKRERERERERGKSLSENLIVDHFILTFR